MIPVIHGYIHDDDDPEFTPEHVALVGDEIRIIRASEVVGFMRAHNASLRTAAPYFGVSFNTLHRFLKANGYRKTTSWEVGR